MKRAKIFAFVFVSVLASLSLIGFVLTGCGTNPTGGGGVSSRSYFGTQSPGDAWSWIIRSNGTLWAKNETKGWEVEGTHSILPSGISLGTITSSTTTEVSPGSNFYFLEYPETMLIVKPTGESENVIVCAAKSNLAPTEDEYIWITIPRTGWTTTGADSYGKTKVTIPSSYEFNVTSYYIDGTQAPWSPTTESGYIFSDGILSHPSKETKIALTPSGIFIGDSGKDGGGFAGFKEPSSNPDISEICDKEYVGVLFHYDPNVSHGGSWTEPVGAKKHDTIPNAMVGYTIDVNTGAKITDGCTIELMGFDANVTGVITGELTDNDGKALFKMIAYKVNNKHIIMGISYNITSGNPYNFVVVEK